MALIKHPGYIINKSSINKIMGLTKTQNLIAALVDLDECAQNLSKVAIAEAALLGVSEIEIAVIRVECELPNIKHLAYVTARADESLMFGCAYLESVLGEPPYRLATEFGLCDEEIREYQGIWREAGIEPTKLEFNNVD